MGTKENPSKFDCYANAEPDEPMFVLLARDPLAPLIVEIWAQTLSEVADEALRRGEVLDKEREEEESKIHEAIDVAASMRRWRGMHRPKKRLRIERS